MGLATHRELCLETVCYGLLKLGAVQVMREATRLAIIVNLLNGCWGMQQRLLPTVLPV